MGYHRDFSPVHQSDDVVGDDGKALSERMRKLEVDVGTRKDRIIDAEQDISDAEDEIGVLESEQESAQNALDAHLSGLVAALAALRLLYTSPSPRDATLAPMPSSA